VDTIIVSHYPQISGRRSRGVQAAQAGGILITGIGVFNTTTGPNAYVVVGGTPPNGDYVSPYMI
jgi:hypothetical protein